jgi:hypothetical protein
MSTIIQLRRGTKASLPSVANAGELMYTTDTKEIFVGNGNGNGVTSLVKKHNCVAVTSPTATDDIDAGYTVGSLWVNTAANLFYVCTDSTADGAVWAIGGDTSLLIEASLKDMGAFGFTDPTKSTLSLSGTDKDKVNLDVVSGSYTYYYNGELVTVTTNKSVTLPGTTHANGTYYIYFSDNAGTLTVSQSPWSLSDSVVPVCTVFWYQGNAQGSRSLYADERHTSKWPRAVHRYMHLTRGAAHVSGGALSGYTLATTTNAAVTYGISASTFCDEDITHVLTALTDGNGTGANYTLFYHIDANTWAFSQGNNFPYAYTLNSRMNYDGVSAGLAQATNNYYLNYYVFETNFNGEARYIVIPSQFQYNTQAAAYAETIEQLNFAGIPIAEAVCIAQITYYTSNPFNNTGKSRMDRVKTMSLSIANVISSQQTTITAGTVSLSVVDFNGLLDSNVVDVQKLADAIDDAAGNGISVSSGKFITNSTNRRAISSDTTLAVTDSFATVNTTSGNVTITLPDPALFFGEFILKKIVAANSMLLNPPANVTIDGGSGVTVTDVNTCMRIRSNGSNYFIV